MDTTTETHPDSLRCPACGEDYVYAEWQAAVPQPIVLAGDDIDFDNIQIDCVDFDQAVYACGECGYRAVRWEAFSPGMATESELEAALMPVSELAIQIGCRAQAILRTWDVSDLPPIEDLAELVESMNELGLPGHGELLHLAHVLQCGGLAARDWFGETVDAFEDLVRGKGYGLVDITGRLRLLQRAWQVCAAPRALHTSAAHIVGLL